MTLFSQLIPLRLGQIKTRRKCKELKGGLAKEGRRRRRRGKKQIEKGKKKEGQQREKRIKMRKSAHPGANIWKKK